MIDTMQSDIYSLIARRIQIELLDMELSGRNADFAPVIRVIETALVAYAAETNQSVLLTSYQARGLIEDLFVRKLAAEIRPRGLSMRGERSWDSIADELGEPKSTLYSRYRRRLARVQGYLGWAKK